LTDSKKLLDNFSEQKVPVTSRVIQECACAQDHSG